MNGAGTMRKFAIIVLGLCVTSALCASMPSSARAQTYKADDIIKHFGGGQPQLGVSRGLGPSRGLCVGTEAECNKAGHAVATPAAAAVASAFDLVVKFKYNSDLLEPEAKVNLDEFAKALNDPRLASNNFLVEGHTDARGSANYNLDLSQRRAQSVVRYLKERGVDSTKLLAKGYGQTKPIVPNPFAGDNRRVETRLRVE
jgi:outer membrane protein OmpA-like peptidoglycan-associated protein